MKPGIIREAAINEGKSKLVLSQIVLVICVVIFAVNWKYVYNFVAGSVPFTAALAAKPGPHEFVTVTGESKASGIEEQSTLKLHGVSVSERVSAEYRFVKVDDRLLLVKVEPKFDGNKIEGRLIALPDELAKEAQGNAGVYPWLVDGTTSYRLDFNLIILGAAILLPFAILFFVLSWWRKGDIARNAAIANLKRFGEPLQVVDRIEAEMQTAGDTAKFGPLVLTEGWIVVLDPSLKLIPMEDVVALGKEARTKKASGQVSTKHLFIIWLRGKMLSEEIELPEADAAAAMARVTAIHPWATVDAVAFAKKWTSDRANCEREADQRRGSKPVVA